MAESTWRPLQQTGRWQLTPVLVTAGNLSTRTLRARRLEGGTGGPEEEIPADQFQAEAGGDYTPDWLSFLAQLATNARGAYASFRYR